jgi:hypothetical protein
MQADQPLVGNGEFAAGHTGVDDLPQYTLILVAAHVDLGLAIGVEAPPLVKVYYRAPRALATIARCRRMKRSS